jgi:sensor histidine kinase regulating citrate/malate metabolism
MSYPLNHTYRLLIFVPVLVITLFYVVNSIFVERIIEVNNVLHMTKIENHLQQEEYRILKQKYEDVRLLKHDMKNHLQVIAHLPADKQESYINDYIKSMDYSLAFVIPDQPALEAIINEKYEEAKKKNIAFTFTSHVDLSFVKDIDIVTIFGNLLNNALEANKDGGFIDIHIFEKQYFILIEVKNSVHITHKEGHLGIGLSSIKKIVDRYQGTCSFIKEGDTYVSKIILHKTHFRR